MDTSYNSYLSKSLYIKGLQCHKSLWLHKYRPELKDEVSESQQAVFDSGTDVGILAQQLFPNGIEVPYDGLTHEEQLAMTRAEIDKGTETIYEATFSFDNIFVKVDILHKGTDGWELYEVKSSTGEKEVYLNDIAVQYYVTTGSGINLAKASLVHINNQYTREGEIDVQSLFVIRDVTENVRERQTFVIEGLAAMRAALHGDEPVIDIGPYCHDPYACAFLGYCWAHIPSPSVFDFAGIGKPNGFALYRQGIVRMEETPPDILGWRQRLQLEGLLLQKNVIDIEAIRAFIDTIWCPLYYLDFETTFLTPVPLFDGTRPYQKVPFQFSLHWQDGPQSALKHEQFLADPERDPRETFLCALLEAIPGNACILAYSAFEKTILNELAKAFPSYAERIELVKNNLRDIMAPFRRKDIYHWQFDGSYSLKAVLPALVPELSYDSLDICNGSAAADAWLTMRAIDDAEERERLRNGLLEYCHLDTLAMVKILEKMREMVNAGHLA